MEKSPEIASGHNTSYFRELDARTGRWWSVDPVWQPWQSNYCTFDNNPIALADPSGAVSKVPGQGEGQNPVQGDGKGGGAGGKLGDALRAVANAVKNAKFDENAGRIETHNNPSHATDNSLKSKDNLISVSNQSYSLGEGDKHRDLPVDPSTPPVWENLTRNDLKLHLWAKGKCVYCTDKQIGDEFENIFEKWYRAHVGLEAEFLRFKKLVPQRDKFNYSWRPSSPDFVNDQFYGIANNRGYVEYERVEMSEFYELKAVEGRVDLSSNDYQLEGHILNQSNKDKHHIQRSDNYFILNEWGFRPRLHLITTSDVPYSINNYRFAQEHKVKYYHMIAQFREWGNGVFEYRFVERTSMFWSY
jgi:hypothetical protein